MSREHQGVAGSVVNTVVNYSISIGLGLAGTAESYVNHNGQDILKGYRAASYVGRGRASRTGHYDGRVPMQRTI